MKKIRKEIRSRWHVGEDEFLLVSVGELTKNKNHLEMLRVLAEYDIPNVKYMICGEGELENELKSFIQEHQLEERVVMTGYCSEIENILMSADCFVFPSQREGLPVAMMEAMLGAVRTECYWIRLLNIWRWSAPARRFFIWY